MRPEQIVLSGILITCSVYAIWLTINGGSPFGGMKWAEHHTWATVVAGVSIVILWGSLIDSHDETSKWFWRFAMGGTPLVIRSLLIQEMGDK